ncbi:MAG: PqqD family protein [Acidobacteria bacterium]|nr:PqqD family protein [Acidobacteriota bacterium]
MSDLLPSTRFATRTDVLSSRVGDTGVMLLDPAASMYLGTHGVGALIWQRLAAGPQTMAQLCEAVEAEYDVDAETCRGDVKTFLADLLDRNLIARVDDGAVASRDA